MPFRLSDFPFLVDGDGQVVCAVIKKTAGFRFFTYLRSQRDPQNSKWAEEKPSKTKI
jgi:hypothetical protein